MKRTTRIVITAVGENEIENVSYKVYGWKDNGPGEPVHFNDVLGIMKKAEIQMLGQTLIDSVLKRADDKLQLCYKSMAAGTVALNEAAGVMRDVTKKYKKKGKKK